jgi:hypothetical protein
MLGELLRIDSEGGQHGKRGKQQESDDHDQDQREVLGQVLLFNAHSRADALRYLRRDPVVSRTVLVDGKKDILFDTSVSARTEPCCEINPMRIRPDLLNDLDCNFVDPRGSERAGCGRVAPPHAAILRREGGARSGNIR